MTLSLFSNVPKPTYLLPGLRERFPNLRLQCNEGKERFRRPWSLGSIPKETYSKARLLYDLHRERFSKARSLYDLQKEEFSKARSFFAPSKEAFSRLKFIADGFCTSRRNGRDKEEG